MVAQRQRRSGTPAGKEQWVLLAYRLPREPSTPRSTVWRRLKRLGVAQLADGVVALPAGARTREALDWVADAVIEHGGEATVWLAEPADRAGRTAIVERMTTTVDADYSALVEQATAARSGDRAARGRTVRRLRRELHRIEMRDFFDAPHRDAARAAITALLEPALEEQSR